MAIAKKGQDLRTKIVDVKHCGNFIVKVWRYL